MSRIGLAAFSLGLILVAALLSQPTTDSPRDAKPEPAIRAFGAIHPRLSAAGDHERSARGR